MHVGTGTLVARDEDRLWGTIPMLTFARRPSTMSSLKPVEIPQNSMVWTAKTANIGNFNSTDPLHFLHFCYLF